MLTDAMLREAAAEAERFLLSIVPEDGEPHVFSKRFEHKMAKLIRRTNHPIRYQIMRTAAAVLLAITTLFGAVMAVSPEARAAVVGWVKTVFYEFFEYSNANPNTNNAPDNVDDSQTYEYRLTTLPAGYREWKIIERAGGKTYIYINDKEEVLRFSYGYSDAYSSKYLETTNYMQYPASLKGHNADIYMALEETESNVIVWCNEHNLFFQIFGKLDQMQLVSIAEGVKKQSN